MEEAPFTILDVRQLQSCTLSMLMKSCIELAVTRSGLGELEVTWEEAE